MTINGCISDLQKKTRHSEGKTLVVKYIRKLTLKNCSRDVNKFFAKYLAVYLFICYFESQLKTTSSHIAHHLLFVYV